MNKNLTEIPDYIIHLIFILDTKIRLSPDQQFLLHEWLNESLENWQLLEDLINIWNNSRIQKPPALSEDVVSEMMNKIEKHEHRPTFGTEIEALLHKDKKKSNSGRNKFVQSRRESWTIRMIRVAAILVLTIGIFWLQQKLSNDNKKQPHQQNQIFITENAQQTKIRLPDGSFVHLNAASKLRIPSTFANGMRKIYLDGEAYFEVVHDSFPFIVETDLGEIEDIGTAFNIRIRESSLHVIVTDGKIVFSPVIDTNQIAKQYKQTQDQFKLHVSAGQIADR